MPGAGSVYLALGSNVGNRRANLRTALRWLAPACRVVAVSSLYRSEALVLEGAPPGPDYLNAACAVETGLSPDELLDHVKSIERAIGRRPAARWAPRPIDIDILLFGDRTIDSPRLVVPHPGMRGRNFVLVPLAEIAPSLRHPADGRTIAELASAAPAAGLERIEGPGWAAA